MSKRKISNQKLVIQLGRDETLFALCEKNAQFVHTVVLPTPAGAVEDGTIRNGEAVQELIQSALDMPEFGNVRHVVFSLCTSQVVTETVSTPELSKSKLEKLILANVDMYFPVDMTDYKLVWQTIGHKKSNAGTKEQSVQLWAVPTSMLSRYYSVANNCGLSVSAIDYCGNSIATAVGATFSEPGKGGKERKKLDLNKEITFGRKKKADAEAKAEPKLEEVVRPEAETTDLTHLHLTLEKDLIGLTFVKNNQVVHQKFIQSVGDPAYMFDDVAMRVEYFRSLECGRGTEIIGFVSGALCEDTDIVPELSDILDIPLSVLSGSFDPKLALCAGAVRTKLDFGIRDLNKPNKEFTEKSAQVGQTAALAAGGAALAGVVALTFVARFSWESTIESLEAQRQSLAIQAQKVAGYADKYKQYTTLYDNYSSDWNTVFNNLRTYNDNLVRVLDELEAILPEKSSVTALAIGADGLNVKFACDNKETAAYLIMQLRELQYANLNAVSSLSGGGRGAAKTYGNGETAPTEGDDKLTDEQRAALAQSLIEDFGPYKVVSGIRNVEQIELFEELYGNLPSTEVVLDDGDDTTPVITHECKTLAELESLYSTGIAPGQTITKDMRAGALTALLDTNPFSAFRFVNTLKADVEANMQASWFFYDLMYLYSGGKIKYDTPEDVKSSMGLLIEIVAKDDKNISEAEKLIVQDETLQTWYVYYLQDQINLDALAPDDGMEEEKPAVEQPECEYLAMDAIIADLMVEGEFSSSNTTLNTSLQSLLSGGTKSLLEQYLSTEVPDVTPTPTPTPGSNNFMGMTPELANEQIEKYISTGKTDYYPLLDNQIEKYISSGATDYSDLNTAIDMYITMGMGDEHAKTMVIEYMKNGKLNNETLNALIADAMKNGKTGNETINKRINHYLSDAATLGTMVNLVDGYINNGTSGYNHLDTMLKSYYTAGSSGAAMMDTLISYYNDTKVKNDISAGKLTNDTFKIMFDTVYKSGLSCNNKLYDTLFTRFKLVKSSGSATLDKVITNYLSVSTPQTQPSGGGGGGTAQPVDTRIAFTVSLGYNADLMKAELERKGLDNESKVEKLEVDG